MNRQWRVAAVTRHGDPYPGASLRAAQVVDVGALAPTTTTRWSFKLPVNDPAVVTCGAPTSTDTDGDPYREVQLWYGDELVRWGPIVGMSTDGTWVTFECACCFWYYERRSIAQADTTNFLAASGNPDWEDGFTGWDKAEPSGCTATIIDGYSTFVPAGTPVLKIDNNTTPADPDDDTAVVSIDTGWEASAYPHTITLHARMWTSEDGDPNHRRSGIGLLLLPIEGYTDAIADAYRSSWAYIDTDTPHVAPVDLAVSLEIPPAGDFLVQVRFEGKLGTTWYDGSASVLRDTQAGLGFQGEDQADIARKVSDMVTANADSAYTYATVHPNYPYTTDGYGWDDLNIRPDIDLTGVVRDRRWFFEQRTPGINALRDFAALDDGLEFSIVYDAAAGTRTITSHHPKMGTARPDLPLRFGVPGSNIARMEWRFEQAAANVIVVKSGRSDGREATYTLTSAYAEDLRIEAAFTAPVDYAPDQLIRYAANRFNDQVTPWTILATVDEEIWIDRGLREGDRVPVQIRHGQIRVVDSAMWVRAIEPDMAGHVTLTLTRWPGYV